MNFSLGFFIKDVKSNGAKIEPPNEEAIRKRNWRSGLTIGPIKEYSIIVHNELDEMPTKTQFYADLD